MYKPILGRRPLWFNARLLEIKFNSIFTRQSTIRDQLSASRIIWPSITTNNATSRWTDMADFFLVFPQAAKPSFTLSDSEKIECLTAMRDLNIFWRKIERIVNFWKRKFLGTRFRCKLRSHGTGQMEDKFSTSWIFVRLGDLLTEPVKNLNATT